MTVRVLVSYTQENAAHKDRCRDLADRLRGDGVEAWIDQYVPAPAEGWPRWMQHQNAEATRSRHQVVAAGGAWVCGIGAGNASFDGLDDVERLGTHSLADAAWCLGQQARARVQSD